MNNQPRNQADGLEGMPSTERPSFEKEPTKNDYYELAVETLPKEAKDAFFCAMDVVETVGASLNGVATLNYYIEKSATDTLSSLPGLKELGTVGGDFYKAAQELLINIQDADASPQEYAAREMRLLGAGNVLKETIDTAINEIEKNDPTKSAEIVETLNELKESVENVHAALGEVVRQLVPEPLSEEKN